jgi:hypothetical protein
MKKTKIFYGNQYIDSFYATGKKFTRLQLIKIKMKRFIKKVIFWSVVVLALALTIQYFRWAFPNEIVVEKVKEVIINQEIQYPVLERIAQCESGNSHYDKNGQVILRGNKGDRASVDIGVMQINVLYHGAKATELGLDLTKEADNREYAKYLYTTRGTVDWEASKHCWNK